MNESASDGLKAALEGRYGIQRVLGEGGAATVYLARDLKHSRQVALKVLRPEVAAAYGSERFLSEIQVTARLQHPNVLPLFDSGDADGQLFYVMPWVEGESLRDRLERSPALTLDETVHIASGVAAALDYAHRNGVVHRDVKPGNVLLSDGEALVSDFGIALTRQARGGERLTEVGLTIGTAEYMSPEQSAGDEVDARSDVYSLGCVVYQMLTGSPPFAGTSGRAVRFRHVSESVPSLRALRPELAPALDQVVRKALAKDPDDRYRTASDFSESLRAAAARRRVPSAVRAAAAVLAVAGVVAVGFGAWSASRGRSGALDPNRIVVYPPVLSSGFGAVPTLGEDVATLIGHALDGTGPLRWIDGWTLLDPDLRADIRSLTERRATVLARQRQSAHFVTGRMIARSDSVEVLLDLHDARNDEVVARGSATGLLDDAWNVGLTAVNALLPVLIPGGSTEVDPEWRTRNPGATASFLLGESAFRRVHLEEALQHYRNAVRIDSTFAVAAIRGAQAATWNHRSAEAGSLIRLASARPLPAHLAMFAAGYEQYLAGRGDSAAALFRQAVGIAPEMATAWMQLGETYIHLLPLVGSPDSIADAAFAEARRLDPTAVNLLLHPLEIRFRRGDLQGAAPMLAQFLDADPDSVLAAKIRIMERCARDGAEGVDWPALAAEDPFPLLSAANSLGGVATGSGCATAAFRALLDADTAATPEAEGRRWVALVGTFADLAARGEVTQAEALVDGFQERWEYGSSLFLVGALAYDAFSERALGVADDDRSRWGERYEAASSSRRLWELGLIEALYRNAGVAVAVADQLRAMAREPTARYEQGLSRSMDAVLTWKRGDRSSAIRLLEGLVPEADTGGELTWDEAESRAFERLLLVRLLLESGEPGRALDVGAVFEASSPLMHSLYLPPSLELRAEAARAAGDERAAAALEERRARLRAGG